MAKRMKYSSYIMLVRKELSKENYISYICIANTEVCNKLSAKKKNYIDYKNKLNSYIQKLFQEEKKLRELAYGCKIDNMPNTLSHLLRKRYPEISCSIQARRKLLLDYANYMKARKQ